MTILENSVVHLAHLFKLHEEMIEAESREELI